MALYCYSLYNGGQYDDASYIDLFSNVKLSETEFENMVKDAEEIVGNDTFKVAAFLKKEYDYFIPVEQVATATVHE